MVRFKTSVLEMPLEDISSMSALSIGLLTPIHNLRTSLSTSRSGLIGVGLATFLVLKYGSFCTVISKCLNVVIAAMK